MFYFAYGSNMDSVHFAESGITFTQRLAASLSGYELHFNKKRQSGFAAANIMELAGGLVQGILYEIPDVYDELEEGKNNSLENLRDKEGYHIGHYKEVEVTVIHDGKEIKATTYIATEEHTELDKDREAKLPITREYLDHVLAGRDLISEDYFEWLKSFESRIRIERVEGNPSTKETL